MKKLLTLFFVIVAIVSCLILSSCGHEHEWSEWETLTNPTCTQNGLKKRVCSCGVEDLLPVSALGHTESDAATCTEAQKCLTCGEVLAIALGHTEGDAATCTEPQKCLSCGEVLAEALGHTEGDWTVDVEPTCTEDGSRHSSCTVCGETITTEAIEALGHYEIVDEAKRATCEKAGLTEGAHCSVCNTVTKAQQVTDALGHDFVIDAYVAPTCSDYGWTEGESCTRCNAVKVESERIDKLPHTPVNDEGIVPTCTDKGLTDGSHCSVCRSTIVAQVEIPAKGHSFDKRTNRCDACGIPEYTVEITNVQEYEALQKEKEVIFYLNQYVGASDDNTYYYPVSKNTEFLRIVGDPDRTFKFYIDVETRSTPLKIEFVDVNTHAREPIVRCKSNVAIEIGLYGEICTLWCDQAKAGANESLLEIKPVKGNTGSSTIDVKGDLTLIFAASDIYIEGGKGGDGGNAQDTWGYDADDGADGGDGGFAISANTITATFGKGVSKNDVVLAGGLGGNGGRGGEATGIFGGDSYLYDDGEYGKVGNESAPTNVEITYK